jgi:hypothetical protein
VQELLSVFSNMSRIDFIGIGAPKCGTTWLSAQLEAHPQIGFAPEKEVYYFADTILRRVAKQELRCFDRGETWYHEQFPPAGGAISSRGNFVLLTCIRRKQRTESPLTDPTLNCSCVCARQSR